MTEESEVEESNRLFRAAWATVGRCSRRGRIIDLPGLRIVDSGQPWVFMNSAFLTEPVASAADLESRASASGSGGSRSSGMSHS